MEGAQDAQAVLRPELPQIRLRLLLTDNEKAQRLMYLSLLILPLGYPLAWIPGVGSTLAFGCAFVGWMGVYGLIRKSWPNQFVLEEGNLTSTADSLVLAVAGQQEIFPLDASTTMALTYKGFEGERLTTRIHASGIDNFIQINGGETYRFEMPNEQAQENLRLELRRWYHLKVKVKEQRQGGPTFLLHRDLSYEQIQAAKQEFGVGLYGQ